MGGKIYYGAPSFEECKQFALEYQKTKDEKLFWRFLHRFDRLGQYTCWKMRKRYEWLRKVETNDTDQTSYVGMYKAFNTIGPEERPEYIPLRVITYVKHELTTTYHYLLDEYRYCIKKIKARNPGGWIWLPDPEPVTETYTLNLASELDEYKHCSEITGREAELIHLIFVDGWTLTEAAKKMAISVVRIHQILHRSYKKLKEVLAKEKYI